MFSSVLCPVDFSEQSLRALRYAAALAGRDHGRLTVLHVADPLLVAAAAAGADIGVLTREIETELASVVASVKQDAGSSAPAIETHVTTGSAAEDIVKYASRHAISLIVLGTYGLTGYRKWLLGSVAERVLRRATVPVLVVPQMERDQVSYGDEGPALAVERVLAPCDFSDRSIEDVGVAQRVAATLGVPLLLLHVVPEVAGLALWRDSLDAQRRRDVARSKERLEGVATSLGADAPPETLVTIGRPAESIAKVAAQRGAGLIVMGLSGEGGWFGGGPGTTAYRALSSASVPVLALPGDAASRKLSGA